MDKEDQAPVAPAEVKVNAGSKRTRSEKSKEERPSKRVKKNNLSAPAAEVVDNSAVASTSQFVPVVPSPSEPQTPKKGRGRPKKTITVAPAPPTDSIQPDVQPITAPLELSPKKRGKAKEKKGLGLTQLKWKVVPSPTPPPAAKGLQPQRPTTLPKPKPRIWAASREELLATMPEMAGSKCYNGISWELYETPVLLLDEKNINVFQIQRDGLDEYSLDLITTRSFVCPLPLETISQEPEFPFVPVPDSAVAPIKLESSEVSSAAPSQKTAPKPRRAVRYNVPKGVKAAFTERETLEVKKEMLDNGLDGGLEPSSSGMEFATPHLPISSFNSGGTGYLALGADHQHEAAAPVEPLGIDGQKSGKKKGRPKTKTTTASKTLGSTITPLKKLAPVSAPVPGPQQARPTPSTPHLSGSAFFDATLPYPPPAFSIIASHLGLLTSSSSLAVGNSTPASLPASSTPPATCQSRPLVDSSISSYSALSQDRGLDLRIVHSPSPSAEAVMEYTDAGAIHELLDRAAAKFMPEGASQIFDVASYNPPWRIPKIKWQPGDTITPATQTNPLLASHHGKDIVMDGAAGDHASKELADAQQTFRPGSQDELGIHGPSVSEFPGSTCPSITVAARDLLSKLSEGQPPLSVPSFQEPIFSSGTLASVGYVDVAIPQAVVASTPSESPTVLPPNGMVVESSQLSDLDQNGKAIGPKTFEEHLLDYVPSPIPLELQALVDSYLFGRPLTLILARGLLSDIWGLEVPEEMGYTMMGYFRILGIQETRLPSESMSKTVDDLSSSGEVEWRFRLQWAPGGEEFILPNLDAQILEDPWWRPYKPPQLAYPVAENTSTTTPPSQMPARASNFATATQQPEEPEEHFPTTAKYRQARVSHHEYKFRHHHFRELYESLLPTYLLAPFGKNVRDLSFPRGWLCATCGKVNFQKAMRHRYCTSIACKSKAAVQGYALSLFTMRDPQDRLPVSLPYNTCPSIIEPQVTDLSDGTRIVTYELRDDLSPKPYISHIFKGNYPVLQDEANKLLEGIQLDIELLRGYGDNSPYFHYSISCPQDFSGDPVSDWKGVPRQVNSAKRFIVTEGRRCVAGLSEALVASQMKIISWVTSGTKKSSGTDSFNARKKPVLILCLGCEVALTLFPKSEILPSKTSKKDDYKAWWTNPGPSSTAEEEAEPEEESLPSSLLSPPDSNDQENQRVLSQKPKTSKRDAKPAFLLKLIHGDIAVLSGDDFDYSIKRDGTSILVIVS